MEETEVERLGIHRELIDFENLGNASAGDPKPCFTEHEVCGDNVPGVVLPRANTVDPAMFVTS